MIKVYITNSKFEALKKMAIKEIDRAKKKFYMKKLNHCKSQSLKNFYENYCSHEFSPVLHELKFQSHFSLYLFLYCKKNAIPYDLAFGNSYHKVSQPIVLNLTQVALLGGISRNTIKKSFEDLVKKGLILHLNNPIPDRSNQPKNIMLVYDHNIIGYEKDKDKVCFDL